jgi:hypothetical protein
MGFFKDVHKLTQQAKEIDKTWDPGQQARDATERMRQMNQQMAAANAAATAPPADAIEATASVVSVGTAAGMINMEPIMPVELLIEQDGMPPRPVSVSIVVPMAQLARLVPGASLPVKVDRTDPNSLAVDWSAQA